jgi:hypothetical protein
VLRNEPPASRAPTTPAAALEEFAKDLRELRSKAGLGYPEMAELSHYTMRTLASAAGGLRLPTLPVTSAYVRACSGNVAEWEDRWQRLATVIEPAGDRAESGPQWGYSAAAEGASGGAAGVKHGGDPRHGMAPPQEGPPGQATPSPHLSPEHPSRQEPSSQSSSAQRSSSQGSSPQGAPPQGPPPERPSSQSPSPQAPPPRGPERVYVITSAVPRRPYR